MRSMQLIVACVFIASCLLAQGCSKQEPPPTKAQKTQPGKAEPPRAGQTDKAPAKEPAPTPSVSPADGEVRAKKDSTSAADRAKAAARKQALEDRLRGRTAKAPSEAAIESAQGATQPTSAATSTPSPSGPMRLGDDRGFAPVAKADDSPAAPVPTAKTDPGKPNRFAPTNRSPSEPARRTAWGPILSSDRMFHCTSCEHDFTLSNNEANTQLREARTRAKEGQSPTIRCPKCGRDTALPAMKCAKCGAAITAGGDPRSYSMKEFFDHCPKCGYSQMRENMLNALRRRKESGRPIDESKLPALMKKALDDARASGEWKD